MPEFCFTDIAVASVCYQDRTGKWREVMIASVYFPGVTEGIPYPVKVAQLVDHCQQNGHLLVLSCDANAHHTVWVSTNTNIRDRRLLKFINGNRLGHSKRRERSKLQDSQAKGSVGHISLLEINEGICGRVESSWQKIPLRRDISPSNCYQSGRIQNESVIREKLRETLMWRNCRIFCYGTEEKLELGAELQQKAIISSYRKGTRSEWTL